jgi:hypothetical protein
VPHGSYGDSALLGDSLEAAPDGECQAALPDIIYDPRQTGGGCPVRGDASQFLRFAIK